MRIKYFAPNHNSFGTKTSINLTLILIQVIKLVGDNTCNVNENSHINLSTHIKLFHIPQIYTGYVIYNLTLTESLNFLVN